MLHKFDVYISCLSTERFSVEVEAESKEDARRKITESWDDDYGADNDAVKWGEIRDDEVQNRELENIESAS